MSVQTRLTLMVLWDDMERTSEHRHFESVEDLAAGLKTILRGGDLSRSGVASLTIAPEEPRTVKRERIWRRAAARLFAKATPQATGHATGSAT